MLNKSWEHFSHEADIGVRGVGATVEEAFEMAGVALTAVITDPDSVKATQEILIMCSAPDIEILLVDWLNAIIYEIDVNHMLFSYFSVEIKDLKLTAKIRGEAIDRSKHHPAVDVKGATMTELKVEQKNHQWLAQCVIDV